MSKFEMKSHKARQGFVDLDFHCWNETLHEQLGTVSKDGWTPTSCFRADKTPCTSTCSAAGRRWDCQTACCLCRSVRPAASLFVLWLNCSSMTCSWQLPSLRFVIHSVRQLQLFPSLEIIWHLTSVHLSATICFYTSWYFEPYTGMYYA